MFKEIKIPTWLYVAIKSKYKQPDEALIQTLWIDMNNCDCDLRTKRSSLFRGEMLLVWFVLAFFWGGLTGAWLWSVLIS